MGGRDLREGRARARQGGAAGGAGAMRDGTKEVLALRSGYRESVESWSEVLRDLKARGLRGARLLMADGNAAIWGAVRQVWPEAGEQRCWNHKMRNVLDPAAAAGAERGEGSSQGRGLRTEPGRGAEGPRSVRQALQAVVSRRRWTYSRTTGSGWWRSTTSPRITGSIYARRTWSRARSLRYGSGRRRREAIQAGRERYGADLEVALGGREAVPKARRSSPPQGRV